MFVSGLVLRVCQDIPVSRTGCRKILRVRRVWRPLGGAGSSHLLLRKRKSATGRASDDRYKVVIVRDLNDDRLVDWIEETTN